MAVYVDDILGLVRASLFRWKLLSAALALNLVALATLVATHLHLAATGGSPGVGSNIHRVK